MPRRQNCVRSRGTFLKTEWGGAWTCAHGQKDRLGSDFAQNLASADEAYPVSVNLVGKGKSGARSAYPINSLLQTNPKPLCVCSSFCQPAIFICLDTDAKLHTELTAVRDDAFA